jgi:hypothetical protein
MTLLNALQTPQLTRLRSASYATDMLVSLFSNRVVFAGQVNTDLSTATSWGQFNYNNVTVGAYTDVEVGQALVICTTNDLARGVQTWYGRVRKAPTSSVIYCNESSTNFGVGAYFWVLDTYLPQYKLSRPSTSDPNTAVELVDYDLPYEALLPMVVGLQTAYAGYVDPATNKLRLAFDVSASYAATNGASISSYAYTFSSGTVVGGATNTAIVVVDFDPGTELWGKCTMTDSGGRAQTRHFGIKVHDRSNYLPDTGFEGGTIEAHIDSGYNATLPAFAGVDSVLNNTCCVIWRANEQYGSTPGGLWGGGSASIINKVLTSNTATLTTSAPHNFEVGQSVVVAISDSAFDGTYVILATTSNTFTYHKVHADVGSTAASGLAVVNPKNVEFVGWLQRENDPVQSDPVHSVLSNASLQFTGVGARMQRLAAQLLAIRESASPTTWGDITVNTPWRAICHFLARYTTLASLCDITFDETTGAFQFPDISTQGGNVLAVVQGMARQINASLEFGPAGQLYIAREAGFLNTFQRGSLVTVANWTGQDAIQITRDYEPNPGYGLVDWTGAFYNTSNGQVTVYTARAPGHAQGEGAGIDSRADQILIATSVPSGALDDLRARVGNQLNILNNNETLDVEHPDGYGAIPLIPSRTLLYTWTLDTALAGANGVNRVRYDTTTAWTVESLSLQHDAATGSRTVRARYRRLTPVGDLGDDTTQNLPPMGNIEFPDLGLPAFNFELPESSIPDDGLGSAPPSLLANPPGNVAKLNGDELFVWNDTAAAWLRNFITLRTPQSTDITPSGLGSFNIKQGVVDPYFTNAAIPGYLLESDGSNSRVAWNPNLAAPGAGAAWQTGTSVEGTYTVIRATQTQGKVLVYGPNLTSSTSTTLDLDFTVTDGGFVDLPEVDGTFCVWVPGTGWSTTLDNQNRPRGVIVKAVTIAHLSHVRLLWYAQNNASGTFRPIRFYFDPYNYAEYSLSGGSGFFDENYDVNLDNIATILIAWPSNVTNSGTNWLYRLTLTGLGIGVAAGAVVRVSADYGATLSDAQSVGNSPGSVGGFDVQRAGQNSFAAADGKVRRATTLGGSYGDYYTITGGVQARAIIIPYFNWAGTSQVAATNPDIIVALSGADASGRTLLWIEGGATPGTVHDISPVSGISFDNPNCVTVSYQHHIAVIGSVSGVYRLYTTNDRGVTWVNRGTVNAPGFIRCRRNDSRASAGSGTNKGQLYLAETGASVVDYSSVWAAGSGPNAGMWPRTTPFAAKGLDTVF